MLSIRFIMIILFRHMAVLLIIVYLFIPVMGFAHVDAPAVARLDVRSIDGVVGSPCDHCPCSDERDSRCCDTVFCNCAFQSPPVQGVKLIYAPVMLITRNSESFRKLPQVYSSIFVPPQNRLLTGFSDVI